MRLGMRKPGTITTTETSEKADDKTRVYEKKVETSREIAMLPWENSPLTHSPTSDRTIKTTHYTTQVVN